MEVIFDYGLILLQLPLVQACFEGNVVQLTELIGQREDVNAVVSHYRVTLGRPMYVCVQ